MELTKGEETIQLVLSFVASCRYLAAHELYQSFLEEIRTVEETLQQRKQQLEKPAIDKPDAKTHSNHEPAHIEHMNNDDLNNWLSSARACLAANESKLKVMTERMEEIRSALEYQDQNEQWILGASHFGVNTYYKLDGSDGSIIIKMEGSNEELPLFEQCAVIHEADLFHTWIPFCTSSLLIDKIGTGELVK